MKIKTTMLSGVAGALALAALLSSPAFGAGHTLGVDTTNDGVNDTTIYGDINVTNGYLGVNGPTQLMGDLYVEGTSEHLGTSFQEGDEYQIGDDYIIGDTYLDGSSYQIGFDQQLGDSYQEGTVELLGDSYQDGDEYQIGDDYLDGNSYQIGDTAQIGDFDLDGTLTIQSEAPGTVTDTAGVGVIIEPVPGDDDPADGVDQVFTQLGSGTEGTTSFEGNTGIIGETDGDLTLNTTTANSDEYFYYTAREFEYYDATEGAPLELNGTPVVDEEGFPVYTDFVGYYYMDGEELAFMALATVEEAYNEDGTLVDSVIAALEAAAANPDAVLLEGDETPYYAATVGETTGGNLQVGGNAAVEGVTALGLGLDPTNGTAEDMAAFQAYADAGVDLAVGGNVDIDGTLMLGEIDDVEMAIDDNSAAIEVNATNIATNAAAIDVNATNIATNAAAIDVNATNIATNAAAIDVNATNIATNAAAIDVNATNIANNTAAIISNDTDIANNAANIATNATNIATNAANISTNATNIATNAGEIDDLQSLIFVDPHGNTHISGPNSNSLYTRYDETDGNQKLGAIHDMEGVAHPNLVDIDVVTNLNVSGQGDEVGVFTVKKNDAAPETSSSDILDPVAPYLDDDGVVPNTVAVYTEKADVDIVTESFINSGVEADTNGNLTLYKSGGATETIEYVTYVRQDIWDETQGGNAGLVQGSAEVGGYFNANGDFVELGTLIDDGLVDGRGALDPSVFTEAVLADMAAAGYYTVAQSPGTGGNLMVEGDATVDGTLTVAGVDVVDTLNTHFTLVSKNITDIAALDGRVTTNEATLVTHAGLVQANANAITVNAGNIASNLTKINTNTTNIASNLSKINANTSAIASNTSAISTINSTLNTHFSLVSQNIMDIERNARGIAMAAALTHTTILPGMENALDVSLAYFEGETGISISYSRRINEGTQINFAAASTSDFEESVVRGGIGWQW